MKKLALLLFAVAGTAYAGDSVQLITSVTGKNPPVQIDIRNNKICKGKKCLGNYIDFGKPGHANDHFNFDKFFGFTAMDSITWEERDNATGETLECSATISPELNNKNYYSMTFSKGCGLNVYNYSAGNWLTVTVTGKKQLKAPTVQPEAAAPKPAPAPVVQKPAQAPSAPQIQPVAPKPAPSAEVQRPAAARDEIEELIKEVESQTLAIASTAFFNSIKKGDLAQVQKMLKQSDIFDVNAELRGDPGHITPLIFALGKGNLLIIEALLNNPSVDVNKKVGKDRNLTPLMFVTDAENMTNDTKKKVIDLLISRGAKINEADEKTGTVLEATALYNKDLFEYLLQKNANPLVSNTISGRNIILMLTKNRSQKLYEEIKEILKKHGYEEVDGKLQKMNK